MLTTVFRTASSSFSELTKGIIISGSISIPSSRLTSIAAEMIGIVKDRSLATSTTPAYPKIGFVSKPQDWVNPEGVLIHKEDVDITARLCSMQKMHRAYMVTGAICTGAASKIPGTLVYEAMSERAHKSDTLLIGQPYGPMEVITDEKDGKIISGGVYRTARKILDGAVYIPESRLK